jgi:hypothetical protein
MEGFNPSACQIEEAIIRKPNGDTKNITALIAEFGFSQSIESISYKGQLQIYDGVGVLENFGLFGEEELAIVVKAFGLNTVVELKTQLYKIDNINRSDDGGSLTYTLHFISQTSYKAELHKITEAFRDKTGGQIATDIFKRYYSKIEKVNPKDDLLGETLPADFKAKKFKILSDKGRRFYSQGSDGNLQLIIPNYRPSKALEFVAGKSFSKQSASNSYRFFENFDGYHFVTDEFLMEKAKENSQQIKDLYYFPVVSKNPIEAFDQIKNLESISQMRRVNTGEDLYSGGYANKVVEIDLLQHKVDFRTFNYLDNVNYFTGAGKSALKDDVHSEDFIKETFTEKNARQFMVFRDYSGPGHIETPAKDRIVRGDQFYSEIVSNRVAYNHHLNSSKVAATIKGRLDIQAGHVVAVIMPEVSISDDKNKLNKQMGGRYLVHTATQTVKDNTLTTQLTLIKYGNTQ